MQPADGNQFSSSGFDLNVPLYIFFILFFTSVKEKGLKSVVVLLEISIAMDIPSFQGLTEENVPYFAESGLFRQACHKESCNCRLFQLKAN